MFTPIFTPNFTPIFAFDYIFNFTFNFTFNFDFKFTFAFNLTFNLKFGGLWVSSAHRRSGNGSAVGVEARLAWKRDWSGNGLGAGKAFFGLRP